MSDTILGTCYVSQRREVENMLLAEHDELLLLLSRSYLFGVSQREGAKGFLALGTHPKSDSCRRLYQDQHWSILVLLLMRDQSWKEEEVAGQINKSRWATCDIYAI